MGIEAQPSCNEYADPRLSSRDGKPSARINTQEYSENASKKHQVYSIYDETPHTKSRLDGVSSHEAFDKEKLQSNMAEHLRQSLNSELRNQPDLNPKEDYAGDQ